MEPQQVLNLTGIFNHGIGRAWLGADLLSHSYIGLFQHMCHGQKMSKVI